MRAWKGHVQSGLRTSTFAVRWRCDERCGATVMMSGHCATDDLEPIADDLCVNGGGAVPGASRTHPASVRQESNHTPEPADDFGLAINPRPQRGFQPFSTRADSCLSCHALCALCRGPEVHETPLFTWREERRGRMDDVTRARLERVERQKATGSESTAAASSPTRTT